MKRNTILAIGLITATAIGAGVAVPVLAHGSGNWGNGAQQMGGGMMGNGYSERDHGAFNQMGERNDMMGNRGPQGEMMGGQAGMMQMMMGMRGGMGGDMPEGEMMGKFFLQFDANGDGQVTPDEAKAGLTDLLKKYDTDGNGTLSLQEFQALYADAVRERMVDHFQALDNDGDGQVTVDEITAPAKAMERMQKMHDAWEKQAPKGPESGMMNNN